MAPSQQTAVQVVKDSKDVHEALSVTQQPVVRPETGEVLVRILLRPINPADVYKINGQSPHGIPFPFNPGNEGLGRVEANGEGASKLKVMDAAHQKHSMTAQVGQRVVAASWPGHAGPPPNGRPFGTFQQYLAVPESDLLAVPDDIPDEQACNFFINPTTAFGMVETLDVPQGGWLLQTAAGSAVGRATVAICKSRGVRTISVVRRKEHVQELKDLGGDEVINTAEEGLVQRVQEITGGEGVHGATDAVGGEQLSQVIKSLRKGGTVLVYGMMSGANGGFDIRDVLYGGKTIKGFAILRWLPEQKAAGTAEAKLQEVWKLFQEGVLKVPVGRVFPLEQAADAVEESMRQGKDGKALLEG